MLGAMIGESASDRRHDPGGLERCKEFLRIADPGKGQSLAARQGRDRVGIGIESPVQNRKTARSGRFGKLVRPRARTNDQHRVGARELSVGWHAQWTGRQDIWTTRKSIRCPSGTSATAPAGRTSEIV